MLVSVSIDLDPLDCYARIHGQGALPPAGEDDPVLAAAVPRFETVLTRRGVRATFFAIGRTVRGGAGRAAVARLAAAGHELGNHTDTHPYDLHRRPANEVAAEIDGGAAAIEAAGGVRPLGFRGPGYGLSSTVLVALAARAYRYDSSVLPSPPYWAAKAAIMRFYAALGRPSGAALHDPRLAFAPATPYRPDPERPWRPGTGELVELPIAVLPLARLPVIGTSLLGLPAGARRAALAAVARRSFVGLELHGIDLLAADEVPIALRRLQPELRTPLPARLRALDESLEWLARRGARFETLAEVGARVQREGHA